MKRRNFLRIAGSTGVVVAASGIGLGTFVATRTPHAALAPWENAGAPYPDPMRRALSYAILAPNPHNRQPWLVELKNETEAVLTCDMRRLLPATDPFDRQIVIGLGCFLELFALAAADAGHRAQIRLFPEGQPGQRLDGRAIAHLKLVENRSTGKDQLFTQVIDRHTNRNAYDTDRQVTEETLAGLTSAARSDVTADGVVHGPRLETLRSTSRDALRAELLDPQAYQESVDLMRIGRSEIEANPDGIYLGGAFLEALNIMGIVTREQLADRESMAFQVGLDMANEQALTAMGFVWITTAGNGRIDQVMAGRNYLRIALRATGLGLAMQPMSQALQEYAAMQPYFEQVHALLSRDQGERIQMLARFGYASPVAPSPRWALSTRIKRG